MINIEEVKYHLLPTDQGMEEGHIDRNTISPPPHLFWGIKMYPPLGYAPDIYDHAESRYNLPADYYDHVKEFFKYCEDAQIPINAHASPLGMSIGDGFNYIKNDCDALKRPGNARERIIDHWTFFTKPLEDNNIGYFDKNDCALYVDQTNTHPERWARVLAEFPKLRFCFAHFGSKDKWKKSIKESEKNIKLSSLLIDNELQQDWRRMIAENIAAPASGRRGENVYTDISCYTMTFIDEFSLGWRSTMERIADNIKEAIDEFPCLKDKIIMGSDWYMSETKTSGIGDYYGDMFTVLQRISKSGGAIDYWHQFSVINPLRFLGLIPDDPGETRKDSLGNDYYELNKEKILRYLDHLQKSLESDASSWRDKAGIDREKDIVQARKEDEFNRLKQYFDGSPYALRVYTAEVMMNRENNSIKNI
jgi:predicted TIM-barrel fold metal-dependent hydrolase